METDGPAVLHSASEPDVSRATIRHRFRDPALEEAYRREQAARAGATLRDGANGGMLLLALGGAWLIAMERPTLSHPLVLLLLGTGAVLLVFRGAAGLPLPRLQPVLPVLLGAALVLLTVLSSWLMHRAGAQVVLVRYGYAGLMLASIALFLLLRLSPLTAAALNGLGIAAYALVLRSADGFPLRDLGLHLAHTVFALAACAVGGAALERLSRENFAQRHLLAWREAQMSQERARSEALLLNVMPAPIAGRLKAGESPLADAHPEVTVLFADLVGFTPLADRLEARELVALLDRLFSTFDELAGAGGIEKIKTIGDAYMAVAGVPQPRPDHVVQAARLALRMRELSRSVSAECGIPLELRIGLDTGPAVAGVIGRRKFAYDLWGEVVNMAARMESHGMPGRIQVTDTVAAALPAGFRLVDRGVIPVKGAGERHTYWLEGEEAPASPAGSGGGGGALQQGSQPASGDAFPHL